MDNYSLSDLRAVTEGADGLGGSNSWIIIILFLLIFGGGFNGRGELGQYATAASQNEILSGQKFDAIARQINAVGDGLASSTYALNNAITTEGRAIQTQLAECCCGNKEATAQVRYDMANFAAAIQANDTANTQKVLDALSQNKIETLQGQINQLQLQNAMNGVVRYPNAWTYNAGASPFCNCCGNV